MVTAVVGNRQAVLQTFSKIVSSFRRRVSIEVCPPISSPASLRVAQVSISEGRERYGPTPFRARAFLENFLKRAKHQSKPAFYPP